MIDHSKHIVDSHGQCGQWVSKCWVPDYKWWYIRAFAKIGWSGAYASWAERGLLPADADELCEVIP